jgi:hypothetical protein
MPSRSVTLVILAFWLATLGWFFHHDLWPRLRPGEKPPYTIDLAQEASGPHGRQWEVFYNGQTVGHATTWVSRRHEDDTYELTTKCWFTKDKFTFPVNVPFVGHLGDLELKSMGSTYRVTQDGDLRAVEADILAAFRPGLVREHPAGDKGGEEAHRDQGLDAPIEGHVRGVVKDGTFAPVWRVDSPLVGRRELQSDQVEVPTGHSVLSPLQPWNRLLDVQENKVWHIHLFDPLMDSVGNLVPGAGHAITVRELEAGVKQGTEDLTWNNVEVPCLVIEYRGQGGDISGKTYVRKSDGLVLRQEMTRQDHRLTLERVLR